MLNNLDRMGAECWKVIAGIPSDLLMLGANMSIGPGR